MEMLPDQEEKDPKRVHGQKMKGKCKWFDISKGFGFLVVEDGGPDVFVHQTEIQATRARALHEGQEVDFIYATDSNKVRAKEVTGLNGAKIQTHASFLDPTFAKRLKADPTIKTGVAKWFDQKKGYGFLVPSEGGDDLFVHQSEIKSVGFRALTEGQDLEYKIKIETTPDGKELRKAKEVTGPGGLPLQPPGGAGLIPIPPGYPGYGTQPPAAGGAAGRSPLIPTPPLPTPPSLGTGGILNSTGAIRPKTGTVKWYDISKNYGFIIPSDGGQEVFVHQSNVQGFGGYRGLLAGQPVEFGLETKNGHLRAINVTGPAGTPIMPPTPLTYGGTSRGSGGTGGSSSGYQIPFDNFGKRKAPGSSASSYKAPRTDSPIVGYPDLSLYSTQTYSSPPQSGSDFPSYSQYGGGGSSSLQSGYGASPSGYGSSQSMYNQTPQSNPYANNQLYGGGGLFQY